MAALVGVTLASGGAAAAQPAGQTSRQPQRSGLSIVVIRDQRREGWRRVAVLQEPWFYCSPQTGDLYAVPAGYETDFASIPAFAKLLFPPFGDWAEAAVIHDWLYDVGEPGRKANADRIFDEAMKFGGTGGGRRFFMVLAVKVGGEGAYTQSEKRDPSDWLSHFVDRNGSILSTPPLPQPEKAAWKTGFDCSRLENAQDIVALKVEYVAEHPPMAQMPSFFRQITTASSGCGDGGCQTVSRCLDGRAKADPR